MADEKPTLRVAAVGDLHVRESLLGEHRELLADIGSKADVLVLPGDLTNHGLAREAEVLVNELTALKIPVLAVLGNHDYEAGEQDAIKHVLIRGGVGVLEEEPCEIEGVGFAGVKGFAGGFERHMLEPWGEQVIKRFVQEAVQDALRLEGSLARLNTERKVAVLHYAPIRETVEGEPLEIFPYLGSSRLVEPINRFGATVAFHGHAHHGTVKGHTTTGIPVYNVSFPLLRRTNPEQPYVLVEV